MQPLPISGMAVARSLGVGAAQTLAALRGQKSGLDRCRFETVALDTWVTDPVG